LYREGQMPDLKVYTHLSHARRGFYAGLDREADPEGVLPSAERAKRAEALLKLHMTRMALARAMKRKKQVQEKRA